MGLSTANSAAYEDVRRARMICIVGNAGAGGDACRPRGRFYHSFPSLKAGVPHAHFAYRLGYGYPNPFRGWGFSYATQIYHRFGGNIESARYSRCLFRGIYLCLTIRSIPGSLWIPGYRTYACKKTTASLPILIDMGPLNLRKQTHFIFGGQAAV